MVTWLDRLARSARDLLNILDAIGNAGAGFKSLGDAWADTTTPYNRLRCLAGSPSSSAS
jgi:DNA invertase Pin-like site-specific DNA recombinase